MNERASNRQFIASGTALDQYQRLESLGLWRETPEGQRREVLVRMGQATLIISDPRSEEVLTHWSLPAVTRLNPGEEPALYNPGEDALDSLELTDEDMIQALRKVANAVGVASPRPGRLRKYIVGGLIAALAAVTVLVLPSALVSRTAAMVPAAKRAEIGQRALEDITRLTGAPCSGSLGLPALASLSERIFGPEDTPILYILPEGLTRPAHLPGGAILLPRSLIEEDGPDALAGAALATGLAARKSDPMRDLLDYAGLFASFGLLTSGDLSASALKGYGEAVLSRPEPHIPEDTLVEAFTAAQIPMSPWLEWRDPTGERTADLAAKDPFHGLVATPLLQDDDWIALQSICNS